MLGSASPGSGTWLHSNWDPHFPCAALPHSPSSRQHSAGSAQGWVYLGDAPLVPEQCSHEVRAIRREEGCARAVGAGRQEARLERAAGQARHHPCARPGPHILLRAQPLGLPTDPGLGLFLSRSVQELVSASSPSPEVPLLGTRTEELQRRGTGRSSEQELYPCRQHTYVGRVLPGVEIAPRALGLALSGGFPVQWGARALAHL